MGARKMAGAWEEIGRLAQELVGKGAGEGGHAFEIHSY